MSRDPDLVIAGAGPAGLAAAITAANHGCRVRILERHQTVGRRFHGDFQGLENWSTESDVLDDLLHAGIEPSFDHVPFKDLLLFDESGREYPVRSAETLWYQVRRGTEPGTVDRALLDQALAAGVEVEFGTSATHLPDGGIVAHGPRHPDVIAVGYVTETNAADGAYAVVSDEFAPKGYSYLLIANGFATVASCMFRDFHNEKTYLDRTVDFFQDRVDISFEHAKRFGGYGNVYNPSETIRRDNVLFAGEAAGFQDALFGFGIRLALTSGQLAARAWTSGSPELYDHLIRDNLSGMLNLGLVNRFLFERLGRIGYPRFLRRVSTARDVRSWMRRHYTSGGLRRLLSPLARIRLRRAREIVPGHEHAGCDCTWCRCVGHQPNAFE